MEAREVPEPLPLIPVAAAGLLLPGNTRQIKLDSAEALAALGCTDPGADVILALRDGDGGGDSGSDAPAPAGHGCRAKLIQSFALPEGGSMAILSGLERCSISGRRTGPEGLLLAEWESLEDRNMPDKIEAAAFRRTLERHLAELGQGSSGEISAEAQRTASGIGRLPALIDFLALVTAGPDGELLPEILRADDVGERAKLLIGHMIRIHERHSIDRQIRRRVKEQMEKTHYEFHLSEQAKAIQEELEGEEGLDSLAEQIERAGMPEKAKEKCLAEYRRLTKSPPMSPESAVLRTYIETLVELPWDRRSELKSDMRHAMRVLSDDHYGLEKVKDRIMEYLAVQQRTGRPQGTVMCFVGPPGVGKTSLGKSIARATGREFIRISLGGMHEEAAIRGHRKTYVASMPGRIIKSMAKVKVKNPVFMLDEFDKIVSGSGFHGDPASALLEVLDPEQNSRFTDQYVEVEFDLSEVMFITTANSVRRLPDALLDRLEVIRLPGYTDREKLAIAKRHLLPKQLGEHRLKASDVRISDTVLLEIIRDYTLEAGVRNLERSIARICRKTVTESLTSKGSGRPAPISKKRIAELLEVPEYYSTFSMPARPEVGYANGMVYGAGVFRMEAVTHQDKNEGFSITGVTDGERELTALASVAVSLLQSRHEALGIDREFAKGRRIHIHLQDQATSPFGALGLGMAVLLASTVARCPVEPNIAMLGEINLRGDVISSEYFSEYKSVVMDAQRKKIRRIIMPQDDAHLLDELPVDLRDAIEFVLVRNVWEALRHALSRQPRRLGQERRERVGKQAEKIPLGSSELTRH